MTDKMTDLPSRNPCSPETVLQAIDEALRNGSVPDTLLQSFDEKTRQHLLKHIETILEIQKFSLALAEGDLSLDLAAKGKVAASLKALRSNLRHLTWQAGQIADGDFSQRVHFMGEFSEAFNRMVESLAEEKNARLHRQDDLERLNEALAGEALEQKLLAEKLFVRNQIFETIVVGINLVRKEDGVIVYTNSQFDTLFGYLPGELIGRNVSDLHAPERSRTQAEAAQEIMGKLNARGEWLGEIKSIKKDGTILWGLVGITSFDHPEYGEVWITTYIDITSRKLAEESVRVVLDLNRMIDTLPISECLRYTVDQAENLTASGIGFFLFVSGKEKVLRLMVWSTETERTCTIPIPAEKTYPVEKAGVWGDCIRERRSIIHNDYAGLPHKKGLPKGHVPLMRELVVPIFDAGEIVAVIAVGNKAGNYDDRDITVLSLLAKNAWTLIRRKRAEEKLKESREVYRELVENLNEVIITIDPGGHLVYASPAIERLYGYVPHEVLGKHFEEFVFPEDRARSLAGFREKTTGSSGTDDIRIVTRDGRIEHVLISGRKIIRGGTVAGVEYILTNISDRKKMEDALRQANKKISMLSSITRHDIRNQLMGLSAYLEISRETCHDPELLTYIEKEAQVAEAICHQIEFTKSYEDIGANAPVWQDAASLIRSARSQLSLPDPVKISVDIPHVEVFADLLIEKVFYNLMENTLRHGGAVTKIRFSFHETDEGAEIVYEDDGAGITEADKQKLFQKGFGKNTGLGLFLSREILAITGISIREDGVPGKGVRFVLSIPREGYRFTGNA